MKSIKIKMVAMLVLTAALTGYAQESRTQTKREQDSRTKKWQVQAGWVHQFGRGMSVGGPAIPSSLPNYSGLESGGGFTYPDNNAFISRDFVDGYVHPDLWTGDPDLLTGPDPEHYNMTWNWGVDSASQYDYDGGVHPTINYHIDQGAFADTSHNMNIHNADNDGKSNGIEVKARRPIYSWADTRDPNETSAKTNLDFSLLAGLAWFPETTQKIRRAVGQDLYSIIETYTYVDYYGTEAGGSWPPLDMPYSGTYDDAGALIPMTPESSSIDTIYLGSFVDNVSIKSKMWHLRGEVGVELVQSITERLTIYVAPQAVLEFVAMDVKRGETITFTDNVGTKTQVAARRDKKHKTTFVPGVLITAGVDYRIDDNWYAGASLGWEQLLSNPRVRVGPNKVKYDLGGGEFSLYIGRRF